MIFLEFSANYFIDLIQGKSIDEITDEFIKSLGNKIDSLTQMFTLPLQIINDAIDSGMYILNKFDNFKDYITNYMKDIMISLSKTFARGVIGYNEFFEDILDVIKGMDITALQSSLNPISQYIDIDTGKINADALLLNSFNTIKTDTSITNTGTRGNEIEGGYLIAKYFTERGSLFFYVLELLSNLLPIPLKFLSQSNTSILMGGYDTWQ